MSLSDDDIASDSSSSQWNGDSDDSEDDLHSSVENLVAKKLPQQKNVEPAPRAKRCGSAKSQVQPRTSRASTAPKVVATQRSKSHAANPRLSDKQEQGMASSDSQPTVVAGGTPEQVGDASAQRQDQPGSSDALQNPGCTEINEENDAHAEAVRAANIKALLTDTVHAERTTLMPKFLQIREGEKQLRKPFSSPQDGAPARSKDLLRRLSAKRRFIPWGGGNANFVPMHLQNIPPPEEEEAAELPTEDAAPPPPVQGPTVPPEEAGEPLVLWAPGEGEEGSPVRVEAMLTKFLREHQRDGLQFLFDCVTGRKADEFEGLGCILADDMGLGKTLQGVALLWTLLRNGAPALGGTPVVKRAIIVCPTSLVSNWDSECKKWLMGKARTMPLCEAKREDIIHSVSEFLGRSRPFDVLIVSYETFRIHKALFLKPGAADVDLMICDEAHRLKNADSQLSVALNELPCRRRVLLSGTPMQNHLDEFYAMVSFCNPGVLGSPSEFKRRFENPILASREPTASADAVAKGEVVSEELSSLVNNFILRRTNTLLSKFQPPKLVEVVCCKMTQMQRDIYCHFLESKAAARLLKDPGCHSGGKKKGGGGTQILGAINTLKKLCNHPKLIYDVINGRERGDISGFDGCAQFFPPGVFDDGRPNRGGMAIGWEALSGKFAVVAKMLSILWKQTDDKIVIVSNYTQTLELLATLCRQHDYPFVQLDGKTSQKKRQKLVDDFCDSSKRNFVFLLSSKAGGCGLNLIGANRLILFDPDWNPATDKQAAARVWRNGQRKHVYVYRLLATGTLEEKIFQRQLSKEGLSNVVNQSGKSSASLLSSEDLADLFTPEFDSFSSTYEGMVEADLNKGAAGRWVEMTQEQKAAPVLRAQIEQPTEDEVKDWAWHSSVGSVDDEVLRVIGADSISFVFSLHVPGCEVQEACGIVPGGRGAAGASGGGACGGGRGRLGAGRLGGGTQRTLLARKSCPAGSMAGTQHTARPSQRPSVAASGQRRPSGIAPRRTGGSVAAVPRKSAPAAALHSYSSVGAEPHSRQGVDEARPTGDENEGGTGNGVRYSSHQAPDVKITKRKLAETSAAHVNEADDKVGGAENRSGKRVFVNRAPLVDQDDDDFVALPVDC